MNLIAKQFDVSFEISEPRIGYGVNIWGFPALIGLQWVLFPWKVANILIEKSLEDIISDDPFQTIYLVGLNSTQWIANVEVAEDLKKI